MENTSRLGQAIGNLDGPHIRPAETTNMLKRGDVIKLLMRELANKWKEHEAYSEDKNWRQAMHARSSMHQLRAIRTAIYEMPSYVSSGHAADDRIPIGTEWSERVRIAGEMTSAPNGADPAMLRLLADLRKPLDQLHDMEETMLQSAETAGEP